MKGLLPILLLALFSINAFSTDEVYWDNTPLKFEATAFKKRVCSDILKELRPAGNAPSFSQCLTNASFMTLARAFFKVRGREQLTMMKLQWKLQDTVCQLTYKKTFAALMVAEDGSVYKTTADWKNTHAKCTQTSTDLVLTAKVGEAHVRKLTEAQFMQLPLAVRRNMSEVDILVEAGDGYYRQIESHHYQVMNPAGEVVGYIEESILSNTEFEDDESTYYVRFDAQGKRISEIGNYE